MTLGAPCSGADKGSFAYNSIKDRWPRILTKIIDQLHQKHHEHTTKFGAEGDVDIKEVIHSISRLRYLIATDKPLEPLTEGEDIHVWNDEINKLKEEYGDKATWYKLPWLFTECFVYKLIHGFFQKTAHLKEYDPFRVEKEKGFFDSKAHLIALGTELLELLKKDISVDEKKLAISRHLQICLWGNKADLSLSGGDPHFLADTLFKELDDLRDNILVDDLDQVTDYLLSLNKKGSVAFILDNSGLEVFTDLCLATFLISTGVTDKVVFHGKNIPWYVSDVMEYDMNWVVDTTLNHEDKYLQELGQLWKKYFNQGTFEYTTSRFYTLGFAYCEIEKHDLELLKRLQKHQLLIFKGDLNYRKLVGDRSWDPLTPFKESIRGFEPTSFVSLRTLKAETVSGLSKEALQKVQKKFGEKDFNWMVSSDYAVVQSFFKN